MQVVDQELLDQIKELVNQINFHKHRYYELSDPILTDEEYDQLYDMYLKYQEMHPELIKNHNLQVGVGYSAEDNIFKKVKHKYPMKSLEKFTELEDTQNKLNKWKNEGVDSFTIQPKIDGVSLAVVYKNGVLFQAVTRGDGIIGDDVTHNAYNVKYLPKTIPYQGTVEIRGEVYTPKSVFQKVQEKYPDLKNERNATSGAIRQKDPEKSKDKGLHFFAYDIYGMDFDIYEEVLETLKEFKFKVSYHKVTNSIDEKLLENLKGKNDKLDFLTDGLVIKVNSMTLRKLLGYNTCWPEWAFAFKFQGEVKQTKLIGIEWSVKKSGAIHPTGITEPLKISGVTVHRASLHNIEQINKLGIKIGSTVLITRSGEIIPKIIGTLDKKGTPIIPPSKCPVCETKVIVKGPRVFCPNKNCSNQVHDRILQAAKALEIDNMGPAMVSGLINTGALKNEFDLFSLTLEQILDVERTGIKTATKLLENIKQAKENITAEKVLTACNIPGVRTSPRKLLEVIPIEKFEKISVPDIVQVDGFSIKKAETIVNWFSDEENKELFKKLLKLYKKHSVSPTGSQSPVKSKKLAGLTFVLTGSLPTHTRDQMHKKIREHGGRIATSVTSGIDYVLAGDNAGNKLSKAQNLGKPIISEAEILKMMGYK